MRNPVIIAIAFAITGSIGAGSSFAQRPYRYISSQSTSRSPSRKAIYYPTRPVTRSPYAQTSPIRRYSITPQYRTPSEWKVSDVNSQEYSAQSSWDSAVWNYWPGNSWQDIYGGSARGEDPAYVYTNQRRFRGPRR